MVRHAIGGLLLCAALGCSPGRVYYRDWDFRGRFGLDPISVGQAQEWFTPQEYYQMKCEWMFSEEDIGSADWLERQEYYVFDASRHRVDMIRNTKYEGGIKKRRLGLYWEDYPIELELTLDPEEVSHGSDVEALLTIKTRTHERIEHTCMLFVRILNDRREVAWYDNYVIRAIPEERFVKDVSLSSGVIEKLPAGEYTVRCDLYGFSVLLFSVDSFTGDLAWGGKATTSRRLTIRPSGATPGDIKGGTRRAKRRPLGEVQEPPRRRHETEPGYWRQLPEDIGQLIETLATGNSPPEFDDQLVYHKGFSSRAEVRALTARGELLDKGLAAFPYLIRSCSDSRYSYTSFFSGCCTPLTHLTVGDVCYELLEKQVRLHGDSYKPRDAAGGKTLCQPNYLRDLYETGKLEEWWTRRSSRTLRELQLECVDWEIAQETQAGFVNPAQEADILKPLLELRKQLGGAQP